MVGCLLVLAPFVIGVLLVSRLVGVTVWEGIGLFLGLSIAFTLFKIIFASIMVIIMQAWEDRGSKKSLAASEQRRLT